MTEQEQKESKESNERIAKGILWKVASHNIQNPYYGRIKQVLDEMVQDMDRLARE